MNFAARNALILRGFDRHAAHPSAPALRKAAEQCLAISQDFAIKRAELERDSRYTIEGKLARLKEVRAEVESQMQLARGPIDSAANFLERLRGQLKPTPVEHIPSSGISAADYLKALTARDEQLNGATVRQIEGLEPVLGEATAAAGVAANDLASSY
jgi:hypothetical protein